VPFFCVAGRDRRFVQEMQDQSIKRGSSVKELGDRRDAANCANGSHGWTAAVVDRAFVNFNNKMLN
jgi:hypothetical protein